MKLYGNYKENEYNSVYTSKCKLDIIRIVFILKYFGYDYVDDFGDCFYTYDGSDVYLDIEKDGSSISIISELVSPLSGNTKSYHMHHLGMNNIGGWRSTIYRVPFHVKKLKVKLGWGRYSKNFQI
jgi:hypothetical protein